MSCMHPSTPVGEYCGVTILMRYLVIRTHTFEHITFRGAEEFQSFAGHALRCYMSMQFLFLSFNVVIKLLEFCSFLLSIFLFSSLSINTFECAFRPSFGAKLFIERIVYSFVLFICWTCSQMPARYSTQQHNMCADTCKQRLIVYASVRVAKRLHSALVWSWCMNSPTSQCLVTKAICHGHA